MNLYSVAYNEVTTHNSVVHDLPEPRIDSFEWFHNKMGNLGPLGDI